MAQINNQGVFDKQFADAGIIGFGEAANQLEPTVKPVLIVNPAKNVRSRSGNRSTTGTTTLLTTSLFVDTYLLSAFYSLMVDVTADLTSSSIVVQTFDGTSVAVIRFDKFTTTVFQDSMSISFSEDGLKLARGSTVAFTTTFSVGAVTAAGGITFYEVPIRK